MDDIIYEKDYRKVEPDEHDEWYEAVFDRVINGDMLKSFSDAMDKIPKIIVPEDKKNYEYHDIHLRKSLLGIHLKLEERKCA